MKKKLFFLLITSLIISHTSAQKSSKCNYTINSYKWTFDGSNIGKEGNVTIHDAASQAIINQGNKLVLKGGDVICLDASVSYEFLRFKNIVGDSNNPIVITNVNGQVKIKNTISSFGWKFENSKYFKILGNGNVNHKYGFKVTTHNNSYLQMIRKTTDFEIAHVEIAGDTIAQAQENIDAAVNSRSPKNFLGFAGIMAKSQPICREDTDGGSTDAGLFEMENVKIHHNYIHDVYGEGLYIGYGFSKGTYVKSLTTGNACTSKNYPHFISNLSVYSNLVERVGWDGIQVKNAHHNAKIYNNIIKNYAFRAIGHHDEGLLVGDGSEAEIFGNWIENGTAQSNGIQINATGNTKVYNNVVLGAGYTGLYLNNNNYLHLSGVIEIYNNTLEGGFGNAITSYSLNQVVKIKNNIAFGFGTKDTLNDPWPTRAIKAHPHHIVSSNVTDKDPTNIGFINHSIGDIRLSATSPAIDAGENHSLDQYDYSGSPRIGSVDIGAFEFGSTISNINLSIAITTPTVNSVTATPNGVRVKGTLIDINNEVVVVKYYLNNTKFIGQDVLPRKIEHVIGYQHLSPGVNTFKMKAILSDGSWFYSSPLIITKPIVTSSKSEKLTFDNLNFYYNSQNKELVINKSIDININHIEVYDLLGKKLNSWKNIDATKQTIYKKVDNLPSGIYIIKIKTNTGVYTKKSVF